MEKKDIIDVEAVREEEEIIQQEEEEVRTGLSVLITKDNKIEVNFFGEEKNLIEIQGLLGYAEKYIDRLWDDRLK